MGAEHQGVTPSAEFGEEVEPTRQRDALIGQQLGEYVIEARLGEGAMGIVYRAMQPLISRPVAVKVLKPGFDDSGELLQEARAVSAARHPNIIDIFSFGTTPNGQQYFVMELLAGEALDLWLRSRTLTTLEAVGILKQLLSGLAAAHTANVVHRDLKPGNLFMAKLADDSHFLKILDFGLAKRVDPFAPEKTLGRMAGTPLYMAPEQCRGQATGPQTDLYAVGCIAFELLTGRTPFSAQNLLELLQLHQTAAPPPLPASTPALLTELVMSLLEKEPGRRPASAIVARQTVERVERRLLASSGTNAAHPVQRGDDEVSQPSQPSGKVRARVPITGSEPAHTPASEPARQPVQEPPPRARRSARSIKDAPIPDTSLRPTAPALMPRPARPTVPVRDDDEELSLGASRFRGREDESPEESSAPTAHELEPLPKPASRGPAIAAGVAVVAILCVGLAWKLSEPEPAVIPEAPIEQPRKAVPPPQPEPEIEAATPAKPEPEPPPPEPTVVASPPPAVPVKTAKSVPPAAGMNIEATLTALEERCLLELTEQKQRMALDDLRELRGDLRNASADETRRQVKDFEAHWLKGTKK